MKIRIHATEQVCYSKITEASEEDVDNMVKAIRSGYVMHDDLFLDPVLDVIDGEIEAGDVEVEVERDGKWVPLEID